MDKALVFNPDRCTGCRLCELICSLAHTGTCNPQRSRIRIVKWEEKGINVPMFCQQCEDAICMDVCPVAAITRNHITGLTETDYNACIQCKMCVITCPFGAVSIDRIENDKPIRCDLCGGDAKCVQFCETGGIEFIYKDAIAMRKKREAVERLGRLLKLSEGK
ncbi:MAG: 4Fe-4S dicluster domain-containing protein [Eubacteriales bacterium]